MSWAAVRPVLVGIVAGVAPTIRKQGLPSKFKHDDNGSEGEPIGDSRRFWLSAKSGNAIGHVQPTATRYRTSVDVVVEYVMDADSATMDPHQRSSLSRRPGTALGPSSSRTSTGASGCASPLTWSTRDDRHSPFADPALRAAR
jgi:hypothetical protein